MADSAERRLTWKLAVVPIVLFAYVSAMVIGLAKAHPLSPAPANVSGSPVALGDAYSGELLFQDRCAGCHGLGGTGGGAGPALAGTGLTVEAVQEQVQNGGGVMPAGLATGDDLADVLAYVAQITAH
jgi:mono/diheme cytochrome c family protein